MTKPWKMEFDKRGIHANIKDAIKALADWLILPDPKEGIYVITVKIEKKEN